MMNTTKLPIQFILNYCPEQYKLDANLYFRIEQGLKAMWNETDEEYKPFTIDTSNGGYVTLQSYSPEPDPLDYLDEDGEWLTYEMPPNIPIRLSVISEECGQHSTIEDYLSISCTKLA